MKHAADQLRRRGQLVHESFFDIRSDLQAVMVGAHGEAALDDPDVDALGAAVPGNRDEDCDDSDSERDGEPDPHCLFPSRAFLNDQRISDRCAGS